jgi:hypothetical protein
VVVDALLGKTARQIGGDRVLAAKRAVSARRSTVPDLVDRVAVVIEFGAS